MIRVEDAIFLFICFLESRLALLGQLKKGGSAKGGRRMPGSGFGGYVCPQACPRHMMKTVLQWPPCLAAVGSGGIKSV